MVTSIFHLWLILSLRPISANREIRAMDTISTLSEMSDEMQTVLRDLEKAAQEDTAHKSMGDLAADDQARCCCKKKEGTTLSCSVLNPPQSASIGSKKSEVLKKPAKFSPNWWQGNSWVCPGGDSELAEQGIQISHAKTSAERSECGEDFTGCGDLKEDFEEASQSVRELLEKERAETAGIVHLAELTLRTRAAAKALDRAEKTQCVWLTEKRVNQEHMKIIVQKTLGDDPCYATAKDTLTQAEGSSKDDQLKALAKAASMLLHDDCKKKDKQEHIKDSVNQAIDEAKPIEDVEHETAKINSEVDAKAAELEYEAKRSAENDAHIALIQFKDSIGSLLQKADLLSKGGQDMMDGFGELIAKLFGFIFLVILWALFCWVVSTIVLLILGLIMCTIKSLVVGLVNLFKTEEKKEWSSDWKGCMGWWASALGHSGGSGDVGISLCAASMMTSMTPR